MSEGATLPTASASRVGAGPTATIFEEQSSVLPHWFDAGVHGATLVCVDAHLDLQFIAPERVARLRRCRFAPELAALERPHPLTPCRDGCYGIEDFLFAAAQLGIVRRLVWVAPPQVLAELEDALAALRQMEGVTTAQLDSFSRVPGGWIEGTLLGLDLVAVEMSQLPAVALEGPVLVDIDTDYFVEAPEDRVWAQPADVVRALKERVGPDMPVTIARSVGTGSLPLRHRFLSDQVAALWEGRPGEAAHWQRLLDIEMSDAPQAERSARLRALMDEQPGCAATIHALAHSLPSALSGRSLLARAAALDPHYGRDLLRSLGALHARRKALDTRTLVRLHRRLRMLEDTPERLGAAWVALGLLYASVGRAKEAVECDRQSLRCGDGHPDLALQIGRLEMGSGAVDSALAWLERAAAFHETRVAAWMHLSICASRRGDVDAARRWARAAHHAAPAWPEPRRWLQSLERPAA